MGRKELLALIVAVVCGFLAYMIYVKKPAPPADLPPTEGPRCVVAAGFLEKGTVLNEENLSFSSPLEPSADVANLFLQKEDAIGKRLKERMEQNAYILRSGVETPPAGSRGSDDMLPIPPGMQAVTLDVNEIVGVTNRVMSGQYADIMGDIKDIQGKTLLTTLAYSVPIIAVQKKSDDSIQKITLAFLPDEAETVFGAMAQGKIRMSLLSGKGQKPSSEQDQGAMKIIKGVDHKPNAVFLKEGDDSRSGARALLKDALTSISSGNAASGQGAGSSSEGREGAGAYEF